MKVMTFDDEDLNSNPQETVHIILLRANDLPANVKELLSSTKQAMSLGNLDNQLVIHSFLWLMNNLMEQSGIISVRRL